MNRVRRASGRYRASGTAVPAMVRVMHTLSTQGPSNCREREGNFSIVEKSRSLSENSISDRVVGAVR